MLLAIDTSGAHCTVVLADAATGDVLAEGHEHLGRGHAERLMPMVGEVMGARAWSAITAIGCTTGPGSFTGLRVGMAAAGGLALALGCPGKGVSTFDALRVGLDDADGETAIALDARRGEVWLQAGPDADPVAATPERAADLLPATITRIAGSGAALVAAHMQRAVTQVDAIVTPAALARACLATIAAGHDAPIRPLYLRAPDAKPQRPASPA